MRGVTIIVRTIRLQHMISTHTPHARRDILYYVQCKIVLFISTHTPHARRDVDVQPEQPTQNDFNSHASCEA